VQESQVEDFALFAGETTTVLRTLVERMDKAAKDPEVKAVVLLVEGVEAGRAQAGEIAQAIGRIRAGGKEVYAHADQISGLTAYTIMTAASRVSVVPTADIWINGLFGEAPYLRGLLDKLHVEPDFMTCGAYKSAGELFMRYGPSKEADEMENWLLDSLFASLVDRVAEGRKVGVDKVRDWVDNGPYTAEQAVKLGIIDAVEPRQDLEAKLKEKYGEKVVFDRKYGKKDEPKPDFSSPFGLFKFWGELLGASKKPDTKKPAVGIVYVEGPIMTGREEASLFSQSVAASSKIRKALDDAAADDAIKAVVLRVNSPGGQVVASEIILDATKRVKAKKPFIVSMGDVAGSGGYYVACGTDTIVADPTTITASIGVVSGKLATTGLFDQIGVRFKAYRRGQNAGMLASGEVFTPSERTRMRAWMDEAYEVFKTHVTDARGDRLKKPIDELAGGRVFTGKQALELGLVDKLGTLHDAIALVAEKAKLGDDYDVRIVPRPKSFFELLLEDSNTDDGRKGLDLSTRPLLIELALPYLRSLDPGRAALVRTALGRLELLRRDGIVVMMPEIGTGR
jgi:protease-4